MNRKDLVGKKVKIKNLYLLSDEQRRVKPVVISEMLPYSNRVVTIVNSSSSGYFNIREDDYEFNWADWMFDIVPNFTEESIYE